MLKKYLLGKSSTGKFRYAVVECSEEWEDTGYVIQRSYGQVRGKNTLSPAIVVSQTKQKRNWKEQYTLQFNSEVKKFLDKGYKEVEKHPNEYTDEELNEIYGDVKTRGDGIIKPMLAKQADKVSAKTFDKDYYGSRKVNGVRCLIYYKDGKIQTASRGAVNYNIAIIHIIQHPLVEEFFKNHPEAILDGEIFKMGYTLNKISGICRVLLVRYSRSGEAFY
jgi:hypothetical protein